MPRAFLRDPITLAVASAILILLFFVLREHASHVFGLLPYGLLLLCPLMHLLHHRGHGGHRGTRGQ